MVERVGAVRPHARAPHWRYRLCTAPMLAWMVEEKNIEPHVPVWDKTERKDDSLSSNNFH